MEEKNIEKNKEFEKELNSVDEVTKEMYSGPSYIMGEEIHPNLLGGLIPVDGPVFIGIDGEAYPCRSIKVDWEEKNFLNPIDKLNYPLIHQAVEILKANECNYIYMVMSAPNGFIVRGA